MPHHCAACQYNSIKKKERNMLIYLKSENKDNGRDQKVSNFPLCGEGQLQKCIYARSGSAVSANLSGTCCLTFPLKVFLYSVSVVALCLYVLGQIPRSAFYVSEVLTYVNEVLRSKHINSSIGFEIFLQKV